MIDFLARFPSTNALVATGIWMALTTNAAVLLGWKPPEGWFIFVASFAGVGVAQFTSKRVTQHKEKP
jgi:hypothetical protein